MNTRSGRRNFDNAKRTAFTTAAVAAALVALFFAAKWTKNNFVEAERFKIKKITASGFVNIPEKEFLEKLPVAYGDNIVLSFFKSIDRRMKKEFPGIKHVEAKRSMSGEIELTVKEREPVAWRISAEGAPEGVDCENICFKLKPGERFLPELAIDAADNRIRERIIALLVDLTHRKEKLYLDIVKLYNTGGEIFMKLRDSSEIRWGRYDGEDIGAKLSKLYRIINEAKTQFGNLEYVELHLADEGRVVVMPSAHERKGGNAGGKR